LQYSRDRIGSLFQCVYCIRSEETLENEFEVFSISVIDNGHAVTCIGRCENSGVHVYRNSNIPDKFVHFELSWTTVICTYKVSFPVQNHLLTAIRSPYYIHIPYLG
jgi:hypothetical protein